MIPQTTHIFENVEFLTSPEPAAYSDAMSFMEKRVENVIAGTEREAVWLLEHQAVYTAGTSARESDLIDPNLLPVYRASRGGQYTHHAPGQVIGYLILNLKERSWGRSPNIRKYVEGIEGAICSTLKVYNLAGLVRPGRVGVWIDNPKTHKEEKIASLGIRIRRGVSMHGFSVNINNDLSMFRGIVPCGISDYGVCSLESVLGMDAKKTSNLKEEFKSLITQEIQRLILDIGKQ